MLGCLDSTVCTADTAGTAGGYHWVGKGPPLYRSHHRDRRRRRIVQAPYAIPNLLTSYFIFLPSYRFMLMRFYLYSTFDDGRPVPGPVNYNQWLDLNWIFSNCGTHTRILKKDEEKEGKERLRENLSPAFEFHLCI